MVQDLHFGKGRQYEAFPSDTTTIPHSMAKDNLNKTEKNKTKTNTA